MDDTNENLFCWSSQGRAPKETRAVAVRPTSKGKIIHIIGAISAVQVVEFDTCAFSAKTAKAWVQDMLNNLPAGSTMDTMVLVCVCVTMLCIPASLKTSWKKMMTS